MQSEYKPIQQGINKHLFRANEWTHTFNYSLYVTQHSMNIHLFNKELIQHLFKPKNYSGNMNMWQNELTMNNE